MWFLYRVCRVSDAKGGLPDFSSLFLPQKTRDFIGPPRWLVVPQVCITFPHPLVHSSFLIIPWSTGVALPPPTPWPSILWIAPNGSIQDAFRYEILWSCRRAETARTGSTTLGAVSRSRSHMEVKYHIFSLRPSIGTAG
jgi:hypothetical protein